MRVISIGCSFPKNQLALSKRTCNKRFVIQKEVMRRDDVAAREILFCLVQALTAVTRHRATDRLPLATAGRLSTTRATQAAKMRTHKKQKISEPMDTMTEAIGGETMRGMPWTGDMSQAGEGRPTAGRLTTKSGGTLDDTVTTPEHLMHQGHGPALSRETGASQAGRRLTLHQGAGRLIDQRGQEVLVRILLIMSMARKMAPLT